MMNIKVFSDFACPFCYIGFSIADRLRKEYPDLDIQWYPYILDPHVPLEGSNLEEYVPKEQIQMSYKRIERLGSEYNLVYNNKTNKYNTILLHKASLYAKKEDKYYEFAKESFKYIFEYGKNVALHEVVNEIGFKVGLNMVEMNNCVDSNIFQEEIEKSNNLVTTYEIDSVPTFIVNDTNKITRLKEYEKFKKDLLK